MKKQTVFILLCCFVLQFSNYISSRFLSNFVEVPSQIAIFCFQGLMYLAYPLFGYLADIRLNRYQAIKWSVVIILAADMMAAILGISHSLFSIRANQLQPEILVFESFLTACMALSIIGTGLFQANAIQFGLDQLLEAPTPKLITFIHWYYWSENFGALLLFYGVFLIPVFCKNYIFLKFNLDLSVDVKHFLNSIFSFSFPLLTVVPMVCLVCCIRKYLYIQSVGINPFKNVYRVLRYTWKHKVPEHRSALTYWEEDIPLRIDLGKNKYGGPFTNEEVEDTKTFLRILPLLLCLFGYQLAGDGYSAPEQLQRTGCPSLPVLLLVVYNPHHLSTLVAVIGIPLYRIVIRKMFPCCKRILALTRIWIGLYLALIQVTLYIIIVINYHNEQQTILPSKCFRNSPTINCYRNHLENREKNCDATSSDMIFLWLIIPQILNGLSSLLVSMTVFEFICAQAPRTTQGILIGSWYATFSIRYLVVAILDTLIIERRSWLICEGTKLLLILVSIVLFSFVCKHYRYRQRDEIVNVQGMIEDTYEKWYNQEEQYMQERRVLLATTADGHN